MLPAINSKTRLIRENMLCENFCLAKQYFTDVFRNMQVTLGQTLEHWDTHA